MRPIGVFDSGVGGLTVLAELKKAFPHESFLYFGDTANAPYGDKDPAVIRQNLKKILDYLVDQECKLLVNACNTTCALFGPEIESAMPIPVVGLIQAAAKEAVKKSHTHKIAVFATTATVKTGAYQKAIHFQDHDSEVFEWACPRLVPLVESGLAHTPEAKAVALEYWSQLEGFDPDVFIFGCSHYPYFKPIWAQASETMQFVDPAHSIVPEVQKRLVKYGLLSPETHEKRVRFEVSGNRTDFDGFLKRNFPTLLVILIGSIFFASSLKAQPFTLNTLLERSVSQSERIQQQKSGIEEKLWLQKQTARLQNPVFSVAATRKDSAGDVHATYQVGVSQAFPNGGKKDAILGTLTSEQRMAQLSLEETTLEVKLETFRRAYSYQVADKKVGYSQERHAHLELIQAYLRGRMQASDQKKAEKNLLELKLDLLQSALKNQTLEKERRFSDLVVYVHTLEGPLSLPWYQKGPPMIAEVVLKAAYDHNLGLKQGAEKIIHKEFEMNIADKDSLSDMGLSCMYDHDPRSDGDKNITLGVSFGLPIWHRNDDAIQAIYAQKSVEIAALSLEKRVLEQSVKTAFLAYQTQQALLAQWPITRIETLKLRLKETEEAFKYGTVDLLTYFEMETQIYEAIFTILDAQQAFVEAYSHLIELTGQCQIKSE